jgi:hypothetical protein
MKTIENTKVRTPEQFAAALQETKELAARHSKPYWLVPTTNTYKPSCIAPRPEELPSGTTAILVCANGQIENEVRSSRD